MRRFGVTFVAATTLVGAMFLAVPAQAFASARVAIPGGRPAWATANAFRGQTPGSNQIGFRVYLAWRSDPSSLISAVTTPGSPQYGHYLSPAQFRAQFAPSATDVQGVQQWLSSSGLRIDYVPANNLYVEAEGSVAQAENAFSTTIGFYQVGNQLLRAPETTPTVPSGLPQVTVAGLDDSAYLVQPDTARQGPPTGAPDAPPTPGFNPAPQCSPSWADDTTENTTEPTPLLTSSGTISSPAQLKVPDTGSLSPTPFTPCGYTPAQMRGAYGLSGAATGAGQTVAVIDAYASPTIVQDANTFFAANNVGSLIPSLTASNFTQEVAPGTFKHPESLKQDPQGWYGEETLDIEAVHEMAPQANIVYVGSPNNFQDLDAALNEVVDKHLASMVSNSYGFAGEALPPGYIDSYLNIMQEAAATGVGVYFSSGDSGDETRGVAGATPTPDWPASSPLVTAVGGTSLEVGAGNRRLAEYGWETGNSVSTGTSQATLAFSSTVTYSNGSGGGVSRLFSQPSYQAGVVPASASRFYGGAPMRVVPDVAALGDPSTGLLVGQTQTFPSGVAFGTYRIGGTSVASPLFTGMMADVQQMSGVTIGFANPLLYARAGAFNDIRPAPAHLQMIRSDFVNGVDAQNGYHLSARTIDFDTPLTIHVANGYDDVTGLGSPNGASWLSALAKGAAAG